MGSRATGRVIESPLPLVLPTRNGLLQVWGGSCANYSCILVHFVLSAALEYCINARNGELKMKTKN